MSAIVIQAFEWSEIAGVRQLGYATDTTTYLYETLTFVFTGAGTFSLWVENDTTAEKKYLEKNRTVVIGDRITITNLVMADNIMADGFSLYKDGPACDISISKQEIQP